MSTYTISGFNDEGKFKIVDNKVIIIDEAHNIRSTNNNDKESYLKIKETLRKGINGEVFRIRIYQRQ